ncbi:TIR domain-containing protein [bacterium]|nr:TIR domain-containing protein [bacterium]
MWWNKRIFISFDYDHDRYYRYLLSALKENEGSEIEFDDVTPNEIQSYDIGRIKAVLTRKIRAATHTLVIIGAHANSYHPNRARIGTRNWQWWEIEKSIEEEKELIAVKIDRGYDSPDPIKGQGATWAHAFKVDSILKAIDNAW